jgi:hypothetical protein
MFRLTLPICLAIAGGATHTLWSQEIGSPPTTSSGKIIQSLSDDTSVPIVTTATAAPRRSVTAEPIVSKPVPQPIIRQEEIAPAPSEPFISPIAGPVLGENIKLGGWAQTGYHSQSTGLFNNRPDKVNLQQMWVYLQKEAARNPYWDWGFRADVLYGTDAVKTQAFGNPAGTWDFQNGLDYGAYGWAIPQAYAELAKEDLSVKVGHFFTLVGYEVVTAPDNFFYSHAYTMFNSEPFTHTGAIASYDVNDSTTLHGGWTLGWDTGFNQLNGGSSFLGGFSRKVREDLTFTYISTAGNFGWRGNGYSHSAVFDKSLTENLNYVLQSDLLSTDTSGGNNNEVGINQYLLYTLSERLRAGTRVEWWKSDRTGTSLSTYSVTGGFNITPGDNLIIRPEVRYNWGADLVGADMETPIFGVDAIITF